MAEIKIAVLTISDRASAGTREDTSGEIAAEMLAGIGQPDVHREIITDEQEVIEATLVRWADTEGYGLIVTSGGTGISPRDVTPQATQNVLSYQIPGLAEYMRAVSFQKTPMAALSRAVAG